MFGLAVSDVVWQAGIGAVVTIVLAWLAYKTKNVDRKLEKVVEVGEESLKVGKANHVLGNSASGELKKAVMVSARSLAVVTKDPKHVALADEAERVYHEHVLQAAKVDKINGMDAKEVGELVE